jgi:ATP-binding cassette subfamily B protein
MRNLKALGPYLARYKFFLLIGIFILLCTSILNLTQPYLLRLAIDSLQNEKFEPIFSLFIVLLGLMAFGLGFMQRWTINRIGHRVEADIRSDFFAKTQQLDRTFFDETSIGDLIVNSTSDISIQRNLIVQATISGFNTLFLGSIALTLMFSQNWRLALIGLITLPFLVIAYTYIGRRMDKHYRAAQDQLGEVSNRAQEVFNGIRVVKAYTREEEEVSRYDHENRQYLEEIMRYARWNTLLVPLILASVGVTSALVLWVGGHEIQEGRLTIGQFVQFNAYLLLLVPPLTNIGLTLGIMQAAAGSMGRLLEIFRRTPKITDPAPGESVELPERQAGRGSVEFRQAGLRFGEHRVLRDISFKVEPGKTVAVVGPTGSGKSSLAALVGRVYDPQEGRILFDGVDVRNLPLEVLRREVAYVPQETLLFSLSLRENIAFSNDEAADDEIMTAARLSRLTQDLPQIPGGFDALVGERGVTLSGGQKQRTSIARALLPDASVIILDDALSSVDARTQNMIAANLKALTEQGRTTLIVTQRLTLVKNADLIVVLDNGQIVEQGRHADLLENEGLYARMFQREQAMGASNILDDDAFAAVLNESKDIDETPAPPLPGKTAKDRDRKQEEEKAKKGWFRRGDSKNEADEIVTTAYEGGRLTRLFGRALRYRKLLLIATPIILAGSLLEIAGPLLSKIAIDEYIIPGKLNGFELILLIYVATSLGGFLFRYLRSVIMQFVGQSVVRDLRTELFRRVLGNSMTFFDKNPGGSLIGRLTSDMDAINDLLSQGAVAVIGDLLALVFILVTMFLLDWRLALISVAVMPILFAVSFFFRGIMRRAWRASRRKYSILVGYLAENYNGMLTVQLFNRQHTNFQHFTELNDDYYRSNIVIIYNFGIFLPMVGLLASLANALLLLGGGALISGNAGVTFGLLVAFLQYTERAFQPIRDLAERYTIFQAAATSAERIFGLMDQQPAIVDPEKPKPFPAETSRGLEVRFENVTFGYNTEFPVIKEMNFTIRPGEKIALVGPTGAGKTSVISLLGRNYDIQKGSIKIGGTDVRELNQRDLRRHLALVLQDPVLFKGTIAENIRFGNPDLTDEEMRRAAEQVGALSFIEKLPGKFEHQLQERGSNISAGQRQLISFARAIAYNPNAILILDEATSSVDTESEAIIQEALKKLLEHRTALIIAHRLSTIRDVDRVIVIERGHIAEIGTQEELIAQRGLYFQLYRHQMELVG